MATVESFERDTGSRFRILIAQMFLAWVMVAIIAGLTARFVWSLMP